MNKTELNQKIKLLQQLITDTKASLKSWANQISKYHAQLKALTQQLNILKEQITMNEQNNNNITNSLGGKK